MLHRTAMAGIASISLQKTGTKPFCDATPAAIRLRLESQATVLMHPSSRDPRKYSEGSLVALVALISKSARATLKAHLATIDLQEGQDALLLHLSGHTGAQISDIAKTLAVTSPTISKMVIVLERKGFIERMPPTKDQRHVFVKLTEAGIAAQQSVRTAHEAFAVTLANDFGPDIEAISHDLDRLDQAISGLSAEHHTQRRRSQNQPEKTQKPPRG